MRSANSERGAALARSHMSPGVGASRCRPRSQCILYDIERMILLPALSYAPDPMCVEANEKLRSTCPSRSRGRGKAVDGIPAVHNPARYAVCCSLVLISHDSAACAPARAYSQGRGRPGQPRSFSGQQQAIRLEQAKVSVHTCDPKVTGRTVLDQLALRAHAWRISSTTIRPALPAAPVHPLDPHHGLASTPLRCRCSRSRGDRLHCEMTTLARQQDPHGIQIIGAFEPAPCCSELGAASAFIPSWRSQT